MLQGTMDTYFFGNLRTSWVCDKKGIFNHDFVIQQGIIVVVWQLSLPGLLKKVSCSLRR